MPKGGVVFFGFFFFVVLLSVGSLEVGWLRNTHVQA